MQSLSANGIDSLEDLLCLTSTELMSIILNINLGIAKHLLAFAEDVSSVHEYKRVYLMLIPCHSCSLILVSLINCHWLLLQKPINVSNSESLLF